MIGAQIRSNCLHIESDEQNSRYFFSKEKSRSEAKAMTTMINDEGNTLTDLEEIASEQKKFYQKLYEQPESPSKAKLDEANSTFLENVDIIQIDDTQRENLEQDITREEIVEALNELANNKRLSRGTPIALAGP